MAGGLLMKIKITDIQINTDFAEKLARIRRMKGIKKKKPTFYHVSPLSLVIYQSLSNDFIYQLIFLITLTAAPTPHNPVIAGVSR